MLLSTASFRATLPGATPWHVDKPYDTKEVRFVLSCNRCLAISMATVLHVRLRLSRHSARLRKKLRMSWTDKVKPPDDNINQHSSISMV